MSVVHNLTCMLYITVFIGYGNCEGSYTRQSDESGIHAKVTGEKLTTLPDDLERALEREGIKQSLVQHLQLKGTSTEYILDRAFASFHSLIELEIRCNRYIHIFHCAFADSIIQNVTLVNCELKSLPTSVTLVNVKLLNLRGNQLTHIEDHAFSSYVSLNVLLLMRNGITIVEPGAFIGTNLTYLFLNHNRLSCVPDLGAISSTLISLILSDNHLHKCMLDPETHTFPVLLSLFLKSNGLTILPRICYLSPKLAFLDIADNKFATLSDFRNIPPIPTTHVITTVDTPLTSVYIDEQTTPLM